MRLNIYEIPENGLHQELDLPVRINEGGQPDTTHVNLTAFRFGRKVVLEGDLKARVPLNCSRCLREFKYPVETEFRDEFNPAEESEEDLELADEEPGPGYYRNDELDISDVIREWILLSIPIKPLCSAGCKGLCPECGKDFNEGPCECIADETDPRLAPLSKFKKLMKDKRTE